jgi:drug/metabolite transporter superfamily protein YnfA
MSNETKSQFEGAGARKHASLFAEIFAMMNQNKKFWLLPIVIILLLFGVLIAFSSSAAAPFIYTLF